MPLSLRDGLAPEVEQESLNCAANDDDEVVFPSLQGLLGDVATMVVGRNELIHHVGGGNFSLIGSRDIVVEDLVSGYNAL